jgi:hypothetical protein
MSKRLTRVVALTGISAVLAIGGAGVAQASPDHGGRHSGSNDACKTLKGKKKRHCERHHHDKNHRDKSRR